LSFLGWSLIGCLAYLARRQNNGSYIYLIGSYLCIVLFLCIALGIDGIPYYKAIGVLAVSFLVPFFIGYYIFTLNKGNKKSLYLACISLFAIIISIILALNNEFSEAALGVSKMISTHGFINALVVIPSFYLAIILDKELSNE
jgi:hypothetical protein